MLHYLTGDLGAFDAAAVVAVALGLAVFCTTWISQRRSRLEITNAHELALIVQRDNADLSRMQAAEKFAIERTKIEQGLITSHREDAK